MRDEKGLDEWIAEATRAGTTQYTHEDGLDVVIGGVRRAHDGLTTRRDFA